MSLNRFVFKNKKKRNLVVFLCVYIYICFIRYCSSEVVYLWARLWDYFLERLCLLSKRQARQDYDDDDDGDYCVRFECSRRHWRLVLSFL